MKKLPTGRSVFEELITQNYVYVDKTKHIYVVVSREKYCFLARPRRFGKSLLVSTLESFFLGKKELFRDLWIGQQTDVKWEQYPVVRLNFAEIANDTSVEFVNSLSLALRNIAARYGKKLIKTKNISDLTIDLITQLATLGKVVVLIDEYDKPIIDRLNTPEVAEKNRAIMQNFYSVIKNQDANLRFVFITGVAWFSKISIFSAMNNLTDLSLHPLGATLLGYTQGELEGDFADHIAQQAQVDGTTLQQALETMRTWYNGYRFIEDGQTVYNPFSILSYLSSTKLRNYWFESGTPTFLIEQIKKQDEFWTVDPEKLRADNSILGSFEITKLPLITLLYQTGYVTIKSLDQQQDLYNFCYPNYEVKDSLLKHLLSVHANQEYSQTRQLLGDFNDAFQNYDMDLLIKTMRSIIASIPYNLHIKHEFYYHSLFHTMLYLLVVKVHSELLTSKGRIDIFLETKQRMYIIEIKFEKTGQEALQQIKEKRYYERFMGLGKPITLLGLSFNYSDKQLLVDWVQEEMQ